MGSTTTPDIDQTVSNGSDEEENDSDITLSAESTNKESDNTVHNPLLNVQQGPNQQGPSQHAPVQQGGNEQCPKQKPWKILKKFLEIFKIDSDTDSNAGLYFFSDSESD